MTLKVGPARVSVQPPQSGRGVYWLLFGVLVMLLCTVIILNIAGRTGPDSMVLTRLVQIVVLAMLGIVGSKAHWKQ